MGTGRRRQLPEAGYVLATAFHETAETMQPIAEYGHGKGHPYGAVDQTGKAPYGRRFVRLTQSVSHPMSSEPYSVREGRNPCFPNRMCAKACSLRPIYDHLDLAVV